MNDFAAPYHLFGVLSMTTPLWVQLALGFLLALVAVSSCLVPLDTARLAGRLKLVNVLCLVGSLVVAAATFGYGLLQTFAADGPANQKAAQLATGLTTMMNCVILAVPFGALCGVALAVQLARRPEPHTRHP